MTGAGTQRKPLALVALLAASSTSGTAPLSRERILSYLWPESDEDRGRNSLRQVLHALRRDLDRPELFLGGSEIRLNPALVSSDVGEFLDALARRDLAAAAGRYAGPFLDGFHLNDVPDFSRWVDETRRQLGARAREAFQALALKAQRESNFDEAQRWWRKAAAIDPLDAKIALGLMQSLDDAGDRTGALNFYRVYQVLVRQELEAEPDDRVAALAQRLRTASRPGPPASSPIARPAGQPPVASDPDLPPGRPSALLREPAPEPAQRRTRPVIVVALLIAIVAIGLARLIPRLRGSAADLEPNLIAVAPFTVLDPGLQVWREGLVDVLSRNIDGLGQLRTVPPSVVIRQWSGTPDPENASGLGRATGAGLVLFGTLVRAGGDSLRFSGTLVDAGSGRVLADLERRESAARMDRLTDSVAVAVLRELGDRAGDAVGSRPAFPSKSLEALKLFLRGEQFFRRTEWDSARAYYDKALARDDGLTLAYRRLGTVVEWQRLSGDSSAELFLLRAGALNHGLTARDSVLVRADSLMAALAGAVDPLTAWGLEQDLLRTVRHAVRRYPDDPEAWQALGETGYHFGTGPRSSIDERELLGAFDRAIALDSAFAPAYLHAIELALAVGGRALGHRHVEAYLALEHGAELHWSARLIRALLDTAPGAEARTKAILDTIAPDALIAARSATRHWVDTAETAIRLGRLLLARRSAPYATSGDTALMRLRLAQLLAFRGHLRESAATLGSSEFQLSVEVALLGGMPPDSADALFGRWLRGHAEVSRFATAWWSARRDTAALRLFFAHAEARLDSATAPSAELAARYDSAAALAHLALATGDSALARIRLAALPDSGCTECYLDRLILARLHGAAGDWRAAGTALNERLVTYAGPAEVLFALERARVATHDGTREERRRHSAWVVEAWMHADSSVHRLVDEARRGAR